MNILQCAIPYYHAIRCGLVDPIFMKGVDHGDEILVRDKVHNAVAAGGDPTSSWFEDFHVVTDIAVNIGWSAFNKRPSDVYVPKRVKRDRHSAVL